MTGGTLRRDLRVRADGRLLSLIDAVEAMPRNQQGADKSGRWPAVVLRPVARRESQAVCAGAVTHPLAPLARSRRNDRFATCSSASPERICSALGVRPSSRRTISILFCRLTPITWLRAWPRAKRHNLDLWAATSRSIDRATWLAERVIAGGALTRVTGPDDLAVDLTLDMKGFDFEPVWGERRRFVIEMSRCLLRDCAHHPVEACDWPGQG